MGRAKALAEASAGVLVLSLYSPFSLAGDWMANAPSLLVCKNSIFLPAADNGLVRFRILRHSRHSQGLEYRSPIGVKMAIWTSSRAWRLGYQIDRSSTIFGFSSALRLVVWHATSPLFEFFDRKVLIFHAPGCLCDVRASLNYTPWTSVTTTSKTFNVTSACLHNVTLQTVTDLFVSSSGQKVKIFKKRTASY